MPKIFESYISLIEFVFIFVFSFLIVPYLISGESYTDIAEVHSKYPIAIIEDGSPSIIRWDDYIRSPKTYSVMLFTDPGQDMYPLGKYESFSIIKTSSYEYAVTYNTDNYKFSSKYAIDNGVVTPRYFHVHGGMIVSFVGLPIFIFAIVLTSILNRLLKQYITSRSRNAADAAS